MATRESVWLMETTDRLLGFAVYDELRKYRASWAEVEMKVVGNTIKIYAVPHCAVEDFQPGPLADYNETMTKWKSVVSGFQAGWNARKN